MRKPTPEQKAKSEQRRATMRALARNIASLTELQRAELAMRHPIVTIEGRALSQVNQCMVGMQRPTATVVGGFQQWKRAGRSVKKGEHGLGIWVPIGTGRQAEADQENAEASEGERSGFIIGTVFDVAQTEEKGAE